MEGCEIPRRVPFTIAVIAYVYRKIIRISLLGEICDVQIFLVWGCQSIGSGQIYPIALILIICSKCIILFKRFWF